MQVTSEESLVIQKTKELCQTILNDSEIKSIRQHVDAFMADDSARSLYEGLMIKGQTLQQKQQLGETLGEAEIAEFEKDRETLVNNPVARNFIDAQQAMHKVQESVSQYVSKTFELGRVPSAEDFDSGSCGSGCGCH